MEVVTLNVENRTAKGSNQVGKLRNTGKIPLILYGLGSDPISLQADYVEVKRHLEHHLRVYKLNLDSKDQASYLQHVQWDCLTDEPLHLDFQRIDMNKPLQTDVEFVLLGHPKGASAGGVLIRDIQVLHLSCLPANVPEHVEIKVADLDIGDVIFARDLVLPEGCTLDMPEDQAIVHVAAKVEEVPEEETEAVEGEEGAAPAEGGEASEKDDKKDKD